MRSLVEGFAKQLEEAVEIGGKAKFTPPSKPISNVLINGMGGSGIGGTIVSELVSQKSKVPVCVNKSYFLPEYVNENTLIIISSYSGNTEETIQALEFALEKHAKIVCIASGGKILDFAAQEKIDYIVVPQGIPPRAALGYSMVQILYILENFNIINDNFKSDLEQAIRLINSEEENIKTEAERIATVIFGKLPVIYAPAGSEGVAVRLRQELNENSKMLAWHNVIPEMNHNELLGWSAKNDELAVVFFRNPSDYPRISKRIDLTKEIVLKYASRFVEIYSKGDTDIERAIYHIHIGDWISVILAEMKKVDPDEMEVIEKFKTSL